MKTLLYALLIGLLATTASGQENSKGKRNTIRMGASKRLFQNLDNNDVVASMKIWASTVIQQNQLDLDVEVQLFDQPEEIKDRIKKGLLDSINIPTDEFNDLNLNTEMVFLPVLAEGIGVSYVVLVHEDSDIQELKDLKGLNLTISENYGMILARNWFQQELSRTTSGTFQEMDIEIKTASKPADGIFKVFFRQADAAIMTLGTYELACQLNPQLQKKVKILTKSPEVIPSVFVFNPRFKGKNREHVENAVTGLHHSVAGMQVLTLFQCSRMEKHPVTVLDKTLNVLSGDKSVQ